MTEKNQVCISKKLIYFGLFGVLVISAIFITNKLNQKNLSYKSEASVRKALCGNNRQLCCENDTCNRSLKCYSSEKNPKEKRCNVLNGVANNNKSICGEEEGAPCCNSNINSETHIGINTDGCADNFICDKEWRPRQGFEHLNPWDTGICRSKQKMAGGLGESCRGKLGDNNRCDTIKVTKINRTDSGNRKLHCYSGIFDDGSTNAPVVKEMCGSAEINNNTIFSPILIGAKQGSTYNNNYYYRKDIDIYGYKTNALGMQYIIRIECNAANTALNNQYYIRVLGKNDFYYEASSHDFIFEDKEKRTPFLFSCVYGRRNFNYNAKIKVSMWVKESLLEPPYQIGKETIESISVSSLPSITLIPSR